jgi:hypothetical protein
VKVVFIKLSSKEGIAMIARSERDEIAEVLVGCRLGRFQELKVFVLSTVELSEAKQRARGFTSIPAQAVKPSLESSCLRTFSRVALGHA